jgi:hypothetical protein
MRVPLTARRAPVSVVIGALALFACGLLAGCAGSPSTGTDDPGPDSEASNPVDVATPTGPTAAPGCAMAPVSLIKETLNLDVNPPTQTTAGAETECTYLPVAGANAVVIRFAVDEDATSFASRRHDSDAGGEPTSDVPGVGDEAYSSTTEFGETITITTTARKGTVVIELVADATVDKEKALLTRLFAAVG